jgi:hypothetical protein
MKIENVPQDHDPTYEGATKLCYALDAQGRFVKARTDGWHVEETVKAVAWQAIEKDLAETRVRVNAGGLSTLTYNMKLRQMDPALLAKNMGMWTWRVKWHLRPRVFAKLNSYWLQKYSNCLEISVDDLKAPL